MEPVSIAFGIILAVVFLRWMVARAAPSYTARELFAVLDGLTPRKPCPVCGKPAAFLQDPDPAKRTASDFAYRHDDGSPPHRHSDIPPEQLRALVPSWFRELEESPPKREKEIKLPDGPATIEEVAKSMKMTPDELREAFRSGSIRARGGGSG